jgi:hypothetical protein
MVTRQQVERLEQRIEGLIEQRARQHPTSAMGSRGGPCMKTGEEITEAELEARSCAGRRIVHVIVGPHLGVVGDKWEP